MNNFEYTQAERNRAIIAQFAEFLGVTPDDLHIEPESPPADASPRLIAKHLVDAGLLRTGAWRRSPRDRWQPLESDQHLRAALEILLDDDVDKDTALHVQAHVDLISPPASDLYDELLSNALRDDLSWSEARQWAREMVSRRLPR